MSRPVAYIAAAVTLILIAVAHRYGYHRDELYFLEAGRHLDWAYADQGPLTPLLARVMSEISATSLTVFRIPAALAAGTTVLLTGLTARELGGSGRAQTIAAACAAVGVIVLFTGHLLSTSVFDLLAWTAVIYLAIRAIRTGDDRLWLLAGVVLGLGLLNKPLPAFLAAGLLIGVAIAGPRDLLRNRFVWAGAVIALLLWSPWLIWQQANDWPQLDVSREIAGGGSTSSEPWWAIVPFQVLLISPLLAPVWIAGLVGLFRDPSYRFIAIAWIALALVFMATGGKPYYLAGLLPVLLAAGAIATDAWLTTTARRAALATAIALSAVIGGTIALPLLPEHDLDPVLAVNEDVGETVGWERFADQVEAAHGTTPQAIVLTQNYGQAGALDRYTDLPVYSGHNAYGDWGPPPPSTDRAPVITVGRVLQGCTLVARVDTRIDNGEDGTPIMRCSGARRPWSETWPALRHYG